LISSYEARPQMSEKAKRLMEKCEMIAYVSEALGFPRKDWLSEEEMAERRQELAEQLLSHGQIDPAFAYAMKRMDFKIIFWFSYNFAS
jgi:hypothetical protein